jgi:transposase
MSKGEEEISFSIERLKIIYMEQIIKQCVGIDSAKKDFEATFSICDSFQEIKHVSSRKFTNDDAGFKAFNKWMGKFYKRSIPLLLVMEATGVYHERLAHFLYDLGYKVSVVLPKRAKDFSKTLKVKKITDKIASQYLAIMGLEKKLDLWNKPKKMYADLNVLWLYNDSYNVILLSQKYQIISN